MPAHRQRLMEEMKNVPLLESKMRRMTQIQQERMALRRQRERVAARSDRPSAAQLKEFHELLDREDKLTSVQQALIEEVLRDAPAIRDQIRQRRETLRAQVPKGPGAKPDAKGADPRSVNRVLRMYEFLEDRFEGLGDSPRRLDSAQRLMKGLWGVSELDAELAENMKRQLGRLEEDLEETRCRLRGIEAQMTELREVLDLVGPPSRHSRR